MGSVALKNKSIQPNRKALITEVHKETFALFSSSFEVGRSCHVGSESCSDTWLCHVVMKQIILRMKDSHNHRNPSNVSPHVNKTTQGEQIVQGSQVKKCNQWHYCNPEWPLFRGCKIVPSGWAGVDSKISITKAGPICTVVKSKSTTKEFSQAIAESTNQRDINDKPSQ